MTGSIIGDIIGSNYEFNNVRNYDFEMFPSGCSYTDDTICTIAIADAILKKIPYKDSLIKWCRKYPHPKGAYGASFSRWIRSKDPQPYDSFGNGAAMRVSPIGFAFDTEKETIRQAQMSAACSHNHEEGMKGAAAIALAIFRLRNTHDKDSIKGILGWYYGYRLPAPFEWNETCQGCVPLALHLFLDSSSFEDAIRKTVSYGGDSDTLGAIVGGMAEAYYGFNDDQIIKSYLPDEMIDVVNGFKRCYGQKN